MANTRQWVLAKDINTRKDSDGYWGRGGASIRYIGKGQSGEWFRTLMEFTRVWTDMSGGTILTADLVLRTNEQGNWSIGSKAAVIAYALTEEFSDDGSDNWNHDAWDNPSGSSTQAGSIRTGIPTSHNQPFKINLLSYIRRIAPTNVKVQIGTSVKAGEGKTDHGLRLRSPDEGNNDFSVAIFSGDNSAPSGSRPYLEITWEPANSPPSSTWGGPLGPSSSGEDFTGTYYDPDGDRISYAEVQVWRVSDDRPSNPDAATRHSSGKVPWNPSWPDGEYRVPSPSPPLSRKTQAGAEIEYEGRVRTYDTRENTKAGPWTLLADGRFTVQSSDPVVTPTPMLTHDNLLTAIFRAPWTFDQAAGGVDSYRVQLTHRSDSGVWAAVIWDHAFAPTLAEQTDVASGRKGRASFVYGGPSLPAGDYSWRIRVVDGLGVESAWGQDDTLHLNVGTTSPVDPPDNSAVYGRGGITTRLVMRAVDTTSGAKRKPGTVVAIIEDAYAIACTGNATTPGQLTFTLHNGHPQISAMEPMRTHWSLQQYRGGEWRELSAGLLTDFDATENDTVFQGLDYLGILSLSIEAKPQPPGGSENSWDAKGASGAKYVNKTISYIINHQLSRAIAAADSPVGFFEIPVGGIDVMNEKVTIHSAYAQRLELIRGLLDSHRGGATGRRARITASKNPTNDHYEFTVRSNAGRDRANLRFEYGGLVQAYRVMALGDWADMVYGVGRLRNQLKPYYQSIAAPGVAIDDWGEIARASVWQDISDTADLTRRARALATEMSRVGKRIALGLRVHALNLLDGWAICDNIRIDITDGSVDTSLYGTDGWWTIWGWEWRLYPDGHDELTLVVKPTEGVGDPVDDLIPSMPVHVQPEWTIAHGPPPPRPVV